MDGLSGSSGSVNCSQFPSVSDKRTELSFYERNGIAADGCYSNAVFNDSSDTLGDDEDATAAGRDPAVFRSDPPRSPADVQQRFRRSHSMRSSFNSLRSFRTRLSKPATSGGSGRAGPANYSHLPAVGDLAETSPATSRSSSSKTGGSGILRNASFSRPNQDDVRRSLRHKLHKLKLTYTELRRLHAKVLQEKDEQHSESKEETGDARASHRELPDNVPPKAAALLMEGFCRTATVQGSLKVHRRPPTATATVTLTRSHSVQENEIRPGYVPGQQKLTVARQEQQPAVGLPPPVPTKPIVVGGAPNEQEKEEKEHHPFEQRPTASLIVARTATIRKGSVWANNSTKISLPDLVTRSLSNLELPSCRLTCPTIPCPSSGSSSPRQKSCTSSTNSLATIETQTGTTSAQSLPSAVGGLSVHRPVSTCTLTTTNSASLAFEDEADRRKLAGSLPSVTSAVLDRVSSVSSPNLSSARMEYLLPHQQHPPGAEHQDPSPKRHLSPKIGKKTRHLSTSSVDEASDTNDAKARHGPGGVSNHHRKANHSNSAASNNGEAERNARNAQHLLLLRSNRLTVSDNHNLSGIGVTVSQPANSVDVLAVHNAKSVSPQPPATTIAPPSYWKQKKQPTKKQHKQLQAQLDKLTQINIHLHALFSAVEHGHLEKARTILESTDVDVNSLNSDGLTPLDVAVLSNNRSMTKMLLQQGAIENAHSVQAANSNMGLHLNNLLCEAEATVHELGNFDTNQAGAAGNERTGSGTNAGKTSFSNIIGNSGPSVTSCTGNEIDKQVGLWERRVKGLRRMILGWEQTKPPDVPNRIDIDVTGCSAVSLRLYEPLEGAITTKFKVQWSSRSDFSNVVGEREISEWCNFHGCMGAVCNLNELIQGRRYFFRACAGNVKGWGPYKLSVPNCVVPSSWRDVEGRENRFAGKQRNLDELFNAVRLARPEDASEIALDGAGQQQKRATKKKTTIKQLFSAASKFQKNLKRGIYLACILYHEDKLLLTNEDFVPVIEIDETFTSNLHTDFYWLMKVACTWDDVKLLRMDMERNASSAIHFRTKLLSAACQMQSALSITDLGQLFYRPLRDVHGTVVLSCVNCIKSPKAVSVLNSRWIPLNKIHKKLGLSTEDSSINEILMNSIQEQINYHQVSNIRLSRGLYVGYLKMQSSVDVIQVVVPVKAPNVLPHCKIRDNPHVSAEEWELIKQHKPSSILEFRPKHQGPTEVQLHFLEMLTKAVHNLFQYMDIPVDVAIAHRLYDVEVIELNSDVSFLIICPPAESSCAVPGQKESLLQRGDLFSMPIQAFEMIHLKTYQGSIIQKYSRLSCILELDTMLANHLHREAFSSSELQKAKDRLAKLQELSGGLNSIWKGVRWLMDVIGYARDRANMPELNMKQILDYKSTYFGKLQKAGSAGEKKKGGSETQLLHPPGNAGPNSFHKSSPGRGSWPGPAVENTLGHNGLLDAEHSKSEQLLKYNSARFLNVSQAGSRKNSADSGSGATHSSYYSVTGVEPEKEFAVVQRLPPSRSEDTLNSSSHHHHHHHHHSSDAGGKGVPGGMGGAGGGGGKKARPPTIYSSYSATSSPLLNVRSPFLVPMVPATTATTPIATPVEDEENSNRPAPGSSGQSSGPLKMFAKKSRDQALKAINFIEREQQQEMEIFEETKPILTTTYLKPTLAALQNEAKSYQAVETVAGPEREPVTIVTTTSDSSTSGASYATVPDQPTEGATQEATGGTTVSNATSILQVYAAYETGLPSGTSLKLRVTPKTSAREVIDLVVKQLNMAVVLKGREGPIYTPERLDNFCLVAVIGARERCLRDDFRPLQLQNPWRKGRLYVRQKHDLLAAIEHSNRDSADI
uniref:Ras-associating domain-containing protein n=2 Tax=Anopheles atroparvus TaxID=41427 RepID=A0AAG5CXS1_ANOAO